MEYLRLEAKKLQRAQMATATERGYAHDFSKFRAWCLRAHCKPLPASPQTVNLFIASQLNDGKKVSTVCRQAAGVAFTHRREGFPSPSDESVRKTLWGARRTLAEPPRQMRPLTVAQLRLVVARLAGGPVGVRNRAILVVGFATALRRANLAALRAQDVTFCDEGMAVLVRREKQDRQGAGRLVGTAFGQNESTCPVRTLNTWLDIRGREDGPLFTRLDNGRAGDVESLSQNAIGKIVKDSIAAIGLDPCHYGPHSLRAGMITEAGIAGVNSLLIAQQSGHKSLDSLKRYFRPANLFKANASSMIGL